MLTLRPENPRIRWSHPLAKHLVFYTPLGMPVERDLVLGLTPTTTVGSKVVHSSMGKCRLFDGSEYLIYPTPTLKARVNGAGGMTILAWCNLTSSANFKHPFVIGTNGGNKWFDITTSDMSASAVSTINDFPTAMSINVAPFVPGQWTMMGCKFSGGGTQYQVIRNGVITAGSGYAGRATLGTSAEICIGTYEAALASFPGMVSNCMVFSHELSIQQIYSLYINPWQLLEPNKAPVAAWATPSGAAPQPATRRFFPGIAR